MQMNEIFIFFGILFMALIFEILQTIFFFYKADLDDYDADNSNIVAVLAVQAVINAITIAIIATVRYSS